MKYRRALVLAELFGDVQPAILALRHVAPELEHLLIVAVLPAPTFSSLFGSASEPNETNQEALDRLREQAGAAAPSSDVRLAAALEVAPLLELAETSNADLLVTSSRSLRDVSLLAETCKRLTLPLLWPADVAASARVIERVFCVGLGRAGRASIAAFLRDHGDSSLHVTLLSSVPTAPEELASIREISGIHATVDVPPSGITSLRGLLTGQAPRPEVDLVVLTRVPAALMLGVAWPTPVLLLPTRPSVGPPLQRSLDVADIVDDGGPIRARFSYEAVVGSLSPAASIRVAFISGGHVVAESTTSPAGEAELEAALEVNSLGVRRIGETVPAEALNAIERRLSVLRPSAHPLILFDSALGEGALQRLRGGANAGATDVLAVRLRPTQNVRSIRERLRLLGLPTQVIDARAVLDEGPALDVSDVTDPVRLARVAARLRLVGFAVEGILQRERTEPYAPWLPAEETIASNHIEVELDNQRARRWLLEAIAKSQHSVHLQVYMAADDDVGRLVEAALGEAGARGVSVRVLVDSLHGRHGSFGTENPLLTRLSTLASVELRTSRPLHELPSITDLKRRDHRKVVIVDGRLALLGGRNVSHEYYMGFDEVPITATSSWREVPWLDAGARVEGPAVATLACSFRDAWTEAGGAPFEIAAVPPAGASPARVILHRGLRDARTLETYRELIDGARSHVHVVNGFPLVLELQHALLRAHARGVRVRVLTGHLTPTHADAPFPGPWSAARSTATELVHSRLDPLVEAGSEVYAFAVQGVPGWDPALGPVHPHVHAKVMSVDGERFTVGSANFDVTSSYWESELVLVVEDASLAQALEAQIDTLLGESTRWDRESPAWQKLASRRAWMRHWPGVLSV